MKELQLLVVSGAQGLNIKYALAVFGVEPTVVENAQQAFDILKKTTPDLLIVDAHLEDLRGTIVCDRVKRVRRLSDIPVILFVDSQDRHMIADAHMSHADEVLELPFSARDLRHSVKTFLGQKLPTVGAGDVEQASGLN